MQPGGAGSQQPLSPWQAFSCTHNQIKTQIKLFDMWRKAKITLKIYKYVCLRCLPLMFLMQLACVQAGSSPSCCGGGGRALMKRFDLAFLLLFKLKKKMKGKKLLKKSQVESQAESMLSPNV